MPFLLTGAWLSDKTGKTKKNTTRRSGPVAKTGHGYIQPTLPISAAGFPAIALINASYSQSGRQVTISWQDSVLKKNNLPSTTLKALGSGIRWDDQGIADFKYVVIRHSSQMDTLDAYYQGKKIGEATAGQEKFIDSTVTSGNHYYAVGILDSGNTEYYKPSYDQTFTSEPVYVGDLPTPPSQLQATYSATNNSVNLTWIHPDPSNHRFLVYMSANKIGSGAQLTMAVPLGTTTTGQTSFAYSPKNSGNYFYAVIPIAAANNTVNRMINTGNATQSPLSVTIPATETAPVLITGIMGTYNTVSKMINLRWQFRDTQRPGLRVYLNHHSALTNKALLGSSMLIKDLQPGSGKTGIDIAAAGAGDYYLAVISYNNSGGINTGLNSGENVLTQPIRIPGDRLAMATNRVTVTNNIFITNITPVFHTNYREIIIPVTNFVTNAIAAGTNTNAFPAFITNTIIMTNQITNVIDITNTNMIQSTNMIDVTNVIQMTNYINNTNQTDITNFVTQTNIVHVTNLQFKTLFLTNRVIIQSQSNSGYVRQPDSPPKKTPRYSDATGTRLKLRRAVQLFFRSRDRKYRGGLKQSFSELRKIHDSTTDQTVRDQCLLFMGRANYALGQYLTAFRHFVRVQDRLPEESRYWIRRCVSKMR